ncbi:periplasmic protein [Stieleria neptunia]|uniref:Periplasmic protein n=1 Tax=Stieleria neptunia TaxID=2527979 RepID=A0A518HS50_9BACT|nr:BON domain-containing protein [Stieleria neptunia]QDV43672.1 periplasmic protein [Stieleria neptunia]
MRRKYLGLAIAAITALGPASAFGGDREIAEEIMTRLKGSRDSGVLKDFTLDMKVDQGVVLFRGSVSESEQKQLVLSAAEGVEGIAKVVDEVAVKAAKPAEPQAVEPAVAESDQSLRNMLSADLFQPSEGIAEAPQSVAALEIAPGQIQTTAAVELAAPAGMSDQQVVAGVVQALGAAQKDGRLKGFGVDVKCLDGIVSIEGRAGSPEQRQRIISIAESAPGVQGIDQAITVIGQPAPTLSRPAGVPAQLASNRMAPVNVDQVPAMASPYHMNQPVPVAQAATPVMGSPAMGMPMQGTPVAMNHGAGMGAPRYDAPNLPNYAWPGYASYPNYAALTYPQQYSPSAWPYIGPFYPYPQVPMGWRKVSLEWDDGWWFLDFTDR